MIGTIDVAVEAKSPNLPLFPMRAFVGSPSSIRVRNVPKRVGDWNISRVYLTVVYPDGTIKQADCVQTGGVWVGTVEGTQLEGVSENGYTVFADGTDENGNAVTGYVLGKGDVVILDADGNLKPDAKRYYVRMLSAEAETPAEGDLWRGTDGAWYIWQGGEAWPIGDDSGVIGELSAEMSAKADLSALNDYVPFIVDKNGSKTAVTVGTRAISSSVGQYSFACGASNTASNLNTVALGFSNVATGQDAVAIGSSNTADGSTSLAVGGTNKVLAAYSIALGQNNTLSSGSNTTAIGTMNTANGKYGVAMGSRAHADDSGSFVWNGGDKANVFLFPLYYSHGKGTFNINPVSGAAGFYIGEESLADILSAKADLSALDYKRDLTDMKVKGVPENDNSASWFTIKYGTTTENAWYYDEGRWETGQTLRVLAAPAAIFSLQKQVQEQWTNLGEFTLDSDAEATITYEGVTYSITGYIGDLVVSNELNTRLAALEARIAALEGN